MNKNHFSFLQNGVKKTCSIDDLLELTEKEENMVLKLASHLYPHFQITRNLDRPSTRQL